jgi:hypothetical protein
LAGLRKFAEAMNDPPRANVLRYWFRKGIAGNRHWHSDIRHLSPVPGHSNIGQVPSHIGMFFILLPKQYCILAFTKTVLYENGKYTKFTLLTVESNTPCMTTLHTTGGQDRYTLQLHADTAGNEFILMSTLLTVERDTHSHPRCMMAVEMDTPCTFMLF